MREFSWEKLMSGPSKAAVWPWIAAGLLGLGALAKVAVDHGEPINALWLVVASLGCFFASYRFYARFIGARVMGLDAARPTPAHTMADGLDYVATDRNVLFGHHFAAIAGAGPGRAGAGGADGLSARIAVDHLGVVLAGAVQDFLILCLSMRRGGKSLGEMIRMEMGEVAGGIALLGTFMIMVIILAVLALIVVKALAESPWGTFTVAATMPLALADGRLFALDPSGRGRGVSAGAGGPAGRAGLWSDGAVRFLAPLFTYTPSSFAGS
jgi:carbon starvation protein